jgi:hypothetical protein
MRAGLAGVGEPVSFVFSASLHGVTGEMKLHRSGD